MMKKNWLLVITSLTLFVTCFSCIHDRYPPELTGNWTHVTPFPGITRHDAVCFTINDTAYVGLGYNENSRVWRPVDFYKYDCEKDQWKQIADFPGEGRSSAVGFSIGNKGYVGGGYDNDSLLRNEFYEYDPIKDNWTRKADFPSPRAGAIGFGMGSHGYIGMGYNGTCLDDLYQYTPGDGELGGTWTLLTSSGSPRRDGVVFVIGSSAYICGGNNNGTNNNDFWKFTPQTGSWTRLRDISNTNKDAKGNDVKFDDDYAPIGGSNIAAFANSAHGYVINGSVWEYVPGTDLWNQKTSFEGTPRKGAVGFSVENRLYFSTGAAGSIFDDTWEFKPDEKYDPYH